MSNLRCILDPKSKQNALLFLFFTKNITHIPIFYQKKSILKKNTLLSCPYFVQKNSILSKTYSSDVIVFNFFLKNPFCHVHIWLKNSQFCQNYTMLWDKKVNRMPFFFDISRKNHCSHAHILSKKRPFSKKHYALMPIFCGKNVHSHENTWLSYIFFLVFLKKPPVGKPLFGHKERRLCQNYIIIWAKKVNGLSLFPIFTKK